jgi:hypothetical protein
MLLRPRGVENWKRTNYMLVTTTGTDFGARCHMNANPSVFDLIPLRTSIIFPVLRVAQASSLYLFPN